jgi:hypothetical protein
MLSAENRYLLSLFFPAWQDGAPALEDLDRALLLKLIGKNRIVNNVTANSDLPLVRLRMRQKKRALAQLAVLNELSKLINPEPMLLLKGFAISERIYQDYSVRDNMDIDVLVAEDALDSLHNSLTQAGFVCPLSDEEKQHAPQHYHYKKDGVLVELHWHIAALETLGATTDALFAKSQSVTIQGRTFQTLPDRETLIYLISHGARHRWGRIAWLLDVWNMERQMTPVARAEVQGLLQRYGLTRHYTVYQQIVQRDIHWYHGSPRICLRELDNFDYHDKLPMRLAKVYYRMALQNSPLAMGQALSGSVRRFVSRLFFNSKKTH